MPPLQGGCSALTDAIQYSYSASALPHSRPRRAQRSPTPFNMQPYRVVYVDSPSVKVALSEGMLGGNRERVRSAPATVIFAADTQPWRDIDAVVALESRSGGRSTRYLRDLPFEAAVFTAGGGGPTSTLAHCVKASVLDAAGRLSSSRGAVVPTVHSPEAWAFKSACIAAQTFMLASTAFGLGTHPMEGLYTPLVRSACGIPERFAIPLVVSVGYRVNAAAAADDGGDSGGGRLGHDVGSDGGGGSASTGSNRSNARGTADCDDEYRDSGMQHLRQRTSRTACSPRFPPGHLLRYNAFDTPIDAAFKVT